MGGIGSGDFNPVGPSLLGNSGWALLSMRSPQRYKSGTNPPGTKEDPNFGQKRLARPWGEAVPGTAPMRAEARHQRAPRRPCTWDDRTRLFEVLLFASPSPF